MKSSIIARCDCSEIKKGKGSKLTHSECRSDAEVSKEQKPKGELRSQSLTGEVGE